MLLILCLDVITIHSVMTGFICRLLMSYYCCKFEISDASKLSLRLFSSSGNSIINTWAISVLNTAQKGQHNILKYHQTSSDLHLHASIQCNHVFTLDICTLIPDTYSLVQLCILTPLQHANTATNCSWKLN